MAKKQDYVEPVVDVFALQTEGVVCQSTGELLIPDWGDGTDFPILF